MLPIKKVYRALVIVLLTVSVYSHALPEDKEQPIHVSADHATMNDITGVAVYTGDVEIRQGTMILQGSRVEMYRDDEGSIARIITTGTPAQFQQQATPDQPLTKAYGLHMDYRVPSQTVTITEEARVTQDADEFTGERIIYDMEKSVVDAFRSETQGGQRVQMVIQPKANP